MHSTHLTLHFCHLYQICDISFWGFTVSHGEVSNIQAYNAVTILRVYAAWFIILMVVARVRVWRVQHVQWATLPYVTEVKGCWRVHVETKCGNKFDKTEALAKIHTHQSCTTKKSPKIVKHPLDFNGKDRHKLSSLISSLFLHTFFWSTAPFPIG